MIKKLCIIIAAIFLCGCSTVAVNNSKLTVVCSAFPQYDWIKNIIGDKEAEVTLLAANGEDLHSYVPSAADMAKITKSDLFIYVGGPSDNWATGLKNKGTSINMMEEIGISHHHSEGEKHENSDEHIWLSLRKSESLVNIICEALVRADKENAEYYRENAREYTSKLKALDSQYEETVKNMGDKALIFCDSFPFKHLTEDYGINYYAAFDGCSADTEASFDTVIMLANKINETGADNVLIIENSNNSIAETVIGNSNNKNCEILVMDSCQSVNLSLGKTYLSVMEKNLQVLKKALS